MAAVGAPVNYEVRGCDISMMGRLRKSQMPLLALSKFPFSYKNNKLASLSLSFPHSSPTYTKFTKQTHAWATVSFLYLVGPCHSINLLESKASPYALSLSLSCYLKLFHFIICLISETSCFLPNLMRSKEKFLLTSS